MQYLADRLRSVGSDISDQDLVLYTLQGLSSDFETFVTAISFELSAPYNVRALESSFGS
jgi:gag-polypeptide of LTR copia-type